MFVGKNIVYFDLQKTGSSHILKLLGEIPNEKGEKLEKHITLKQLPEPYKKDWSKKIKLGSIRNPWAWYVSLWAFGCLGKGSVSKLLCHFNWRYFRKQDDKLDYILIPRRQWRKTYSDPDSKELFKTWLSMMLSPKRKKDLTEYGKSPISDLGGFYTYRYLRLYLKDFELNQSKIRSKLSLIEIDEKYNFIDYMIHQEKLGNDFLDFLNQYEIRKSDEIQSLLKQRTNSSSHRDFSEYYDEESFNWIKEKEWFIVEKHGYQNVRFDNGIIGL